MEMFTMKQERHETIFTLESTPIKYGPGSSAEAGWEMQRLGAKRVMLVSDPQIVRLGITEHIQHTIQKVGIECVIFANAHVEPTLASLQEAADFARDGNFDSFVAVGGGSSIDTAKVADLIATHPAPIIDYVNAPIGSGRQPPSPLRPLLAIPTTSGTGSETTAVAVLDIPDQKVKTGIAHRYLRPHQGIVDPELTRTLPPEITSSCGLDVVCHAAESFTALPYDARPRPETPDQRPPYQGANPISDIWSMRAIAYGGQYLRRAVENGDDIEARGAMMLAASLAGIGFGTAGVHIPHACSYPIAGLKHSYQPPGYPNDHPFIPHGHSVIVTAPAAFRFTYASNPAKHRLMVELLHGTPIANVDENTFPNVLIELMQAVKAPRGLRELGYTEDDIDDLVTGAMKQQRLLVMAPRTIRPDDLASILRASMENW
jgi:hydroxyacid-oxoacid transhydrogenase